MTVRLLHALALGALAVGHNASAGRALVIGDNGRAGLGNVVMQMAYETGARVIGVELAAVLSEP